MRDADAGYEAVLRSSLGALIVHRRRQPLGPRRMSTTDHQDSRHPLSAPSPALSSTAPRAPGAPDVLTDLRAGSQESIDRLVPVLYDELRRIAHYRLQRSRRAGKQDATLATTALVNEAYLKLVDQDEARWKDRAHFLALAAVAMRHILIDRVKARSRRKRGGGELEVTFDDHLLADVRSAERLLEIDDALTRLGEVAPRLARVVECRFYGGLSEEETAEALQVTVRTVQRDWVKARALLQRALAE